MFFEVQDDLLHDLVLVDGLEGHMAAGLSRKLFVAEHSQHILHEIGLHHVISADLIHIIFCAHGGAQPHELLLQFRTGLVYRKAPQHKVIRLHTGETEVRYTDEELICRCIFVGHKCLVVAAGIKYQKVAFFHIIEGAVYFISSFT